ncbi:antigen 5 like allergen Cul n 1-like [Haematobia irritans]|uniref:antigen 5 like allergen Cul n 1-like n=1 Tax=Haematobia irritans TaxID=7368 RepID=UPI003F5077A6
MGSIRLLLLSALCFGYITATNYCAKNICPAGTTHIACGHSGKFSTKCPKNAALIKMTMKLKRLILHRHNVKRNKVASGTVANHKAACRMATMRWDVELAQLAALNVRQCEMNHDACRNTQAFRNSGQNLAWMTFSGQLNKRQMITNAINMWYNEVSNSKMAYINAFPVTYNQNKEIGHFTVMVADRNVRVGCSAVTYTKNGAKNFLMACNYATTNMQRKPIYASCEKPAAKCKSGKNSRYPYLCSVNEAYSVNQW